MNPLGNCSKFLRTFSKQNFQVLRRSFVDKHGDEDIKWQWSVRESPCQECHKYEEKGWLKRFRRKKETEELTNRHREVVRKPKIWELEYYDYLLPQCKEKLTDEKSVYKLPSNIPCDDSERKECEGKQILIHLGDGHRFQKHCEEKLNFELKEPFSLREVCGKLNNLKGSSTESSSSDEDQKKEKDNFCCLNNLIDENPQKPEEDQSKNSKCD